MTDTAPGSSHKRVYPSGPAQVPAGYQVPADSVELDYHDVAVLLTHLGRPTAESTLRSYKRNGNLPVPDFQLGGRDPGPGEKIKCWAKGPRERDPQPGERIGAVSRWRASTIIAWNDSRKGGGFWRENQTTDGSTTSRPATDPRTPRKLKRAQDRSDGKTEDSHEKRTRADDPLLHPVAPRRTFARQHPPPTPDPSVSNQPRRQ